jgi:hypothetical protein
MSNAITAPVTLVQNTISAPVTNAGNAVEAPVTTTGRDAYQLAVAGGFVGTRAEWIASLKGEPGVGAEILTMTVDDYYDLTPEEQEDATKIYLLFETL